MNHLWRIARAYVMVAWAHRKQKDKAGKPYLWHLVTVAWTAYGLTRDPEAAVVGLLHDYIEDIDPERGWVTIMDRFGLLTAHAVEILSRRRGEAYRTYGMRVGATGGRVVIAVKIADLLHNTDSSRLEALPLVTGVFPPDREGEHLQNYRASKRDTYLQLLQHLAGLRAWRHLS